MIDESPPITQKQIKCVQDAVKILLYFDRVTGKAGKWSKSSHSCGEVALQLCYNPAQSSHTIGNK